MLLGDFQTWWFSEKPGFLKLVFTHVMLTVLLGSACVLMIIYMSVYEISITCLCSRYKGALSVSMRDWRKLWLAQNNWSVCEGEWARASSVKGGWCTAHSPPYWSLQPSPEWLSVPGTGTAMSHSPPWNQSSLSGQMAGSLTWEKGGGNGHRGPEQITPIALRHTWSHIPVVLGFYGSWQEAASKAIAVSFFTHSLFFLSFSLFLLLISSSWNLSNLKLDGLEFASQCFVKCFLLIECLL